MTVRRSIYAGMTRLELYADTPSWYDDLKDELVVHRPFRRALHIPLNEIWLTKLEGVDPYTDSRPLQLRVFAAGRSYTFRLKRYPNLEPLEAFVETLRLMSKENEPL